MKFKVTIALAFGDDREDPDHPFDLMYTAEIEAESDYKACDIAAHQTRRLYPHAVIVTTASQI